MRSSPLSILLVAIATPVLAQDDIVVTGRGLADPVSDAAYSIVTIDRERLTATASGRIEDAVRDIAGLQQFRRSDARSANPTSQGLTLRGLGGNAASRVLVLLDGVPQGDPFAGYINWPSYLPERIGRIRTTRGGVSGAGGSGALAGTIEFDSIVASDARGFAGSLSGGSLGAVDGRAMLAGRLGDGFALVSGGYARGDGFVPVTTPGLADTGARYDQGSVAARAVIPAGAGELQAAVSAFEDIRTRGTDFSRNGTTGADASLRFVGNRIQLLGYLQLRRFTSQFASVNATRTVATQTLDQFNTPASGLGLKAEVRPDLGPVEVRVGAEWRHTSGETNEFFSYIAGSPTRIRKAGGESDIVGGFVEATRAFGALTLTGGGRVDRWWLIDGFLREAPISGATVTETRFPVRSGWEGTGRAAVALAVASDLTLRASASLGWRLPTLNELYRPFRVGAEVTAANAALVPERSRGAEMAVSWQPISDIRIDGGVFVVRLDNAIANVTLPIGVRGTMKQRQNLDALDSRGVEFEASLRRGVWRMALSAAYSDVRTRGSGLSAQLDGLRPASIAPFQASGTLGWRSVSATLRYTSAQFDDDLNTRRLRPALTLDTVARFPLGKGVTVDARVENAFDAPVQAALSAAGVLERASPRAVWLGLRFER